MGARRGNSDEEDEYGAEEEEEDLEPEERGAARDDDEEEEDEGQDEYEKDDFIVDEVEEEVDEDAEKRGSDEEARQRKKKRKKKEAEELDEEDYELLDEAGSKYHRPSGDKKKFKRLKKAGRSEGTIRLRLSDDEGEDGLKHHLFGDDEAAAGDEIVEEERDEEDGLNEEDEMADFIVDEEETIDENGQPVTRRAKKKKFSRQAPGISSSALHEAQEIFGDVHQLLEDRRIRVHEAEKITDEDDYDRRGGSKKLLANEFEDSELTQRYMTETDDRIRDTDAPERLQLRDAVIGPISLSENMGMETEWIYERAFGRLAVPPRKEFQRIAALDRSEIMKQIVNVLSHLHDLKYEVPFIGMYRKESCRDLVLEEPEGGLEADSEGKPVLRHLKALWAVHYWDKKWWMLQRRKGTLWAAFQKRTRGDSEAELEFLAWLEKALKEAPSELAIDDIDAKFNLHFPPDEIELEEGQFKRPKRRSFYSICRKYDLGEVSREFGLSPEHFGENIQAMYKRHEVEDAHSTPEEVATAFLDSHATGEFSDIQSLLKGARHMAAVEISTEPAVREYLRNTFMERGMVTTKPTLEGNRVIDASHQYAEIKWLLRKPVYAFSDGQWLLIQEAEAAKLLEVTIEVPKDVYQEFEGQYLSDGVSRTAQLWNEQRRQILNDALSNFLLPSMEKETRVTLAGRSKQWVALQCADRLWKWVSVSPFPRPPSSDQDDRPEEEAPRVLACCWGSGKPATAFVMLDHDGEIMDTMHAGHLTIRADNFEQQQRKKNDQTRLLEFMKEHMPHVVVLGGANLNCRYLKEDIYEVIFKIVEEYPRHLAEGIDMIQTVFGDETIPRLYENSEISDEQLPQQSGIVKRAVALGRFLQNPLAVVSSLCGPAREILSLELHPLQKFISGDEIYEAVETTMVTVVNQVGIDVNLAASHDWLFAPLQFIGGLGPRKSAVIKRALQGAGRLNVRKDLLTNGLMKRTVFYNSAGFIRVRGTGQAATDAVVLDALDDTRIHPESYDIAKKMADDAFCEEFRQKPEDMDEEALELSIEHVRDHPRVLRNLDIQEYAKVIQDRGGNAGRKLLETLQDIKQELQHGYMECRFKYRGPDTEDVFYLLTGETKDSLCEGKIVQATVRKVKQGKVLCALESGLMGVIQNEDLSDDRTVDPLDKVTEGGVLTCRVKQIQMAKFYLELTSRGSDLRAESWGAQSPQEEYYVPNHSSFQEEEDKTKKKLQERSSLRRMIVHPMYHNLTPVEAEKYLSNKELGTAIFRPSTKGPSHLSLTLKFYHDVYTHVEIVERDKDLKNAVTFMQIGKKLTINDETFEDLDEVVACYVEPLVENWRTMREYRKFRPGSKQEVDLTLRAEKEATPGRVPYYISVSYEHAGVFTLSYIRSVNVHHEYISVSPKGFRFRHKDFDNPDKLVSYFQKHFTDPLPEAPPRRAAASMVPSGWGEGSDSRGRNRTSGWDSRPPSTRVANSGWDSSGYGTRGWDQPPPPPQPQPVAAAASRRSGGSGGGGGWDRPPPPPPTQQAGGRSKDSWSSGWDNGWGNGVQASNSGWGSADVPLPPPPPPPPPAAGGWGNNWPGNPAPPPPSW